MFLLTNFVMSSESLRQVDLALFYPSDSILQVVWWCVFYLSFSEVDVWSLWWHSFLFIIYLTHCYWSYEQKSSLNPAVSNNLDLGYVCLSYHFTLSYSLFLDYNNAGYRKHFLLFACQDTILSHSCMLISIILMWVRIVSTFCHMSYI